MTLHCRPWYVTFPCTRERLVDVVALRFGVRQSQVSLVDGLGLITVVVRVGLPSRLMWRTLRRRKARRIWLDMTITSVPVSTQFRIVFAGRLGFIVESSDADLKSRIT